MTITSQTVTVAESTTTPGTATVTTANATLTDVLSSIFSTTTALTGSYGLLQKVALFGVGMLAESKWKRNTWNPLS